MIMTAGLYRLVQVGKDTGKYPVKKVDRMPVSASSGFGLAQTAREPGRKHSPNNPSSIEGVMSAQALSAMRGHREVFVPPGQSGELVSAVTANARE